MIRSRGLIFEFSTLIKSGSDAHEQVMSNGMKLLLDISERIYNLSIFEAFHERSLSISPKHYSHDLFLIWQTQLRVADMGDYNTYSIIFRSNG